MSSRNSSYRLLCQRGCRLNDRSRWWRGHVLADDVVPNTIGNNDDMVRKVERCGDDEEGEKNEDDRVCDDDGSVMNLEVSET